MLRELEGFRVLCFCGIDNAVPYLHRGNKRNVVVATAADLREKPGIKCDGDRGRGKGRNDVAVGNELAPL